MTAGRRDQLATALHTYMRCTTDGPCWWCVKTIDALLPTVDRMIRQAQAEALEDLASEMDGVVRLCRIPLWETAAKIRDRAAALRASASGTDQPLGDETTPAGTSTAAGTSDTAERH